jgi:acyl carrier protein
MLSENIVKQVVSLLLDVEESYLDANQALSTIDGWDSVNALRVLVYLEREIGASIDYERFMGAQKLGDLWSAREANPVLQAAVLS